MKKILLLIITFLYISSFGQTKVFLDKDISVTINQEFSRKKLSVKEINDFIENDKMENLFIKEKKYLENQLIYNITSLVDPKSFININISKISLPESIDNSTIDNSEEMKRFITNYIDSEVSKNFDKIEKGNAKFINKTRIVKINGVNVLICTISTSLKAKENDILNAESDVMYIFNNKNMIILSVDKSENDFATWNKMAQKIIQSITKE